MNEQSQERRSGKTEQLSEVLRRLFEKSIEPQCSRYESINEVWHRTLPDAVREHCRILEVGSGVLNVGVDSPAYMYELRLHSSGLLRELRQKCKRTRIRSVKYTLVNQKNNFNTGKEDG